MKACATLLAVGLALVAAGCFGGDGDDEQPAQKTQTETRRPAKLVDRTVVEGGPRGERRLLRGVVRGMQKTTLTRIQIGPLEGRRQTDSGAAVAIRFTGGRGPSVRRQWDEWIVAGAFSRRLANAGLFAEVDAVDRDGAFTARPRLRGEPDPRPLPPDREAAVVRRIRRAARRSGADVVRLEIHRPYGVAVALSLRAENPARFLKTKLRTLLDRVGSQRSRLEGMYLAVLDKRRRLALEWGAWTRNPAGAYWVRRDLANCSPIEQSEPPGTEPPPPCPV